MAGTDSTPARVGAAVALTAALFSPRIRGMLRRGAVHGLAGVLTAGDVLASFAHGLSRGMQQSAVPLADPSLDASPEPPAPPAAAPSATGAPRGRKRRSPRSQTASTTVSDAAS